LRWAWAGLLFRTVHLFFIKNVTEGLAWATKILTDPFHDFMLYWRAPLYAAARRAARPDAPRARPALRLRPACAEARRRHVGNSRASRPRRRCPENTP
jgi:hypothetical protein